MVTAANQAVLTKQVSVKEAVVGFSPYALRAPFLLRCAALFIDYMFLLAVPIGWLSLSKLFGGSGGNLVLGNSMWFLGGILFVINFVLLPLFSGQTIGKMLFGLTIVKLDGTPVHLMGLLVRNVLGYLITAMSFGLGFLVSAVNNSGRSLHDYIAGTVVIQGRKKLV